MRLAGMCGGHILRGTCAECGMRRGVPVWLPKERQYLLWVPLADLCGGLRERRCLPRLLWTYAVTMICGLYRTHHLPPNGQGFQPFLVVRYYDCSCVYGEGRPRTPMGIRGASGSVGFSDPCLQEWVDRACPIQGASGPVEFFDPSLRDSRSHGQVRDP